MYSGDRSRFIGYDGSFGGSKIYFQKPKKCAVSFIISGLCTGSSKRARVFGRGTTFIVTKSGEVLIYIINTTR